MSAPAGPVLALDAATEVGSVAVGDGDRLLAEVVVNVGPGHSSALLPAVDAALRGAGVERSALAAVVVGSGPGSFTGLRIAAATAKGIVRALGIPLYAYPSLLATAGACWGADRPVCAIFDARRRDVYAGCWRLGETAEETMPIEALPIEALLERFRGGEPPLFTGEAAALHREEIASALGAAVAPPLLAHPRAAVLLHLLRTAPERGLVPEARAWEPEYVRAAGAERIAAARAGA